MAHTHEHDHDHDHSELTETQLRVRALETVLTEKGYVDPAALDLLIETYEKKVGPRNGAAVVAKAWADPAYRARLFKDATPAIGELGYAGRQGEHIVALENTPKRHNMVVCTLCSCYPWPVLGLPPVWYKSAPYRSRAVSDPRGVLADFGVTLPQDTEIRVWDSTSEIRYLVIPMRPAGTEDWSEEQLAELVTRDSMIGTGLTEVAERFEMNGAQDMGGVHGFGPVEPEPNEPVFHAEWEKRAFALTLAMAMPGQWNIDMSRFARENREPGRISVDELLPDLVRRTGDHAEGARFRQRRRDRRRPRLASTQAGQAHALIRRCAESVAPRRPDRTRDQYQSGIQAGRPGAREKHQPGDAHATAALRARTCRRD